MPSRLLRRRDIYHGCFHTMCPSAQQVTALLGCSVTRSDRLRPARFRARFKCSKRTILAVVPAGTRPGKVRGVEWHACRLGGWIASRAQGPADRRQGQLGFMLGKSAATGRDSYMFFGVDGELMSVKWRYYTQDPR
jgi:hypothetical protein